LACRNTKEFGGEYGTMEFGRRKTTNELIIFSGF
jgi:hypothetical protein